MAIKTPEFAKPNAHYTSFVTNFCNVIEKLRYFPKFFTFFLKNVSSKLNKMIMKMTQNDEKLRQDIVRLFLYCMSLYKK